MTRLTGSERTRNHSPTLYNSEGRSIFKTSLRWMVAAPALIVAVPLLGISFQQDERRTIYRAATYWLDSPLGFVLYRFREIDDKLDLGNFRPLSRLLGDFISIFVFEASEATAAPPHVINGILRLVMLFVLAQIAFMVVSALLRSAGYVSMPRCAIISDNSTSLRDYVACSHLCHLRSSVLAFYPLVLGLTLIANGRSGPIVYFSPLFTSVAVMILITVLVVARDVDMKARNMRWHEPISLAALGAVIVMFYDLAYVAPPLAGAFIVARIVAAGLTVRNALHIVAVRRWIALSAGFLSVFIPVRILIANRCMQQVCYVGSDVSMSFDVLEIAAIRVLSAAPLSGWGINADLTVRYGHEFGMSHLAVNSLLVILLVAIVIVSVLSGVNAFRLSDQGEITQFPGTDSSAGGRHDWIRIGGAIGLFGIAATVFPGLLMSFSAWMQSSRVNYGYRDTLLAQVGWSFIIFAAITMLFAFSKSEIVSKIIIVISTGLLCIALANTLLANARLAHLDRNYPESAIISQISTATININNTDTGNAYRCALINAYGEHNSKNWWAEPGLRTDLNRLMTDRLGFQFCDPAKDETME